MMELRALRKSFGSTMAVDTVSFVAPDGVVTGVLGPNGAGKTTTLRVLSGLIAPDEGAVLVDGIDAAEHPRACRGALGVLPEVVGLYERLTVREHLEYAAALHGAPTLNRGLDDLMRRLGLDEIAKRPARTLSFGQRRRVALARALVHQPQNVILDEPTNALDVLSIRQVHAEIQRLAAQGKAVIVSSHVMPEVAATCGHIVILSKGRVVADGSPEEMLARTGGSSLEEAFVHVIGSEEGLQ